MVRHHQNKAPKKRCYSMTICAAAICCRHEHKKPDAILCIADREFTETGEIDGNIVNQYKHKNKTKAWALSPAMAFAFYSGDPEHRYTVTKWVHEKLIKSNVTNIEHVAEIYGEKIVDFKNHPIWCRGGVADFEIIIAGFDDGGPQLYYIDVDVPHPVNQCGYCMVGDGVYCFDKFMKFAEYDGTEDLYDALSIIHQAKKKSEQNESVGETTDIFLVERNRNGVLPHAAKIIDNILERENEHDKIIEEMKKRSDILQYKMD